MHTSRLTTYCAALAVLYATGCGEEARNPAAPNQAQNLDEIQAIAEAQSGCFGSIGDNVWHDLDADGIREPGEPSLAGVVVNLLGADGAPLATTTVGDFGTYMFFGLCAGEYIVDVDETSLPEGLTWTPSDVGDDAMDCDGDRAVVVLDLDTSRTMDLDFGFMDMPVEEEDPEGCRPWFWRRHRAEWPDEYAPTMRVSEVFGVDVRRDPTLKRSLRWFGWRHRGLMRHAVAGLLNAASPDVNYMFTEEEVIAIVQEAFETRRYRAAKRQLRAANREVCPLR